MTLTCHRCNKRLSRKTARLIGKEVVCSACMFAPRDSGIEARRVETGTGSIEDESPGAPKSAIAHPSPVSSGGI